MVNEAKRPENLDEALREEIRRVEEEVIPLYVSIPSGRLAAALMKLAVSRAKTALGNEDAVAMLGAYAELRDYKL